MSNLQTTSRILLAAAALFATSVAQDLPAAAPKPTVATAQAAPSTAAKTPTAKPRAANTARTPLPLKTQKDKFSYAMGMNLGMNMKKQNVAIDPAIMARGLRDALSGTKPQLTEDEARAAITQMQQEMQKKVTDKMQQEAAVNKKEGDAFLSANKAKPGVVTTASGLQYKIITAGTGAKPATTDTVVCNYRGTLINGKEFDSSYKRKEPATFPVSGVIKGWTEALQLMPAGSKWQLFIPSDLAYGDRGAGADIGPGTTLIFEVELMSIQEKSKDADKK